MKTLIAVSLAILTAMPAHALSCLRPDLREIYHRIDDSPEVYTIVRGKIWVQGGGDAFAPDHPVTVPATFEGTSLIDNTTRVSAQILVNVTCTGAWCGSVQNDRDAIFFLRQVGQAWVLDAQACDSMAHYNPNGAALAIIADCVAGKC